MSPVAYLGKVFPPKGYRKCYICPGLVLQREFNGDVCLVIRLTKYGNCSKYRSVYMFLAPFFDRNSTIIVICNLNSILWQYMIWTSSEIIFKSDFNCGGHHVIQRLV